LGEVRDRVDHPSWAGRSDNGRVPTTAIDGRAASSLRPSAR
jgi:hypothetical protein